MEKDLVLIRNRIIIGIIVALVFTIPLGIFFITKFQNSDTDLLKRIKNKESILILVTDKNCSNCRQLNRIMKKTNIYYYKADINKTKKYKEVLSKIKLASSDVVVPTAIYIKNGKLVASLPNIENKEDLEIFLENYKLK